MASTNAIKFNSIALIICIALCAPFLSMAVLTCCDLKPAFAACDSYARHGGQCVSQDCCFEAMNLLNNLIDTHQDYIAACHCIQDAAVKIPNINYTAFSMIPTGCGIQLPFNFRVDMNCDSLH
ncbi:unnamed protein product [Lathyrus sativus]|nr:unnamed protein product [Lathyrus sativus]